MENAGFWFLMIGLKLPIFLLFWIIYRAVNDDPNAERTDNGDGGLRRPSPPKPRRGPHGGDKISPPPRIRTVTASSKRATITDKRAPARSHSR